MTVLVNPLDDDETTSPVIGFGFQGVTVLPSAGLRKVSGALLLRDTYLTPGTTSWVGIQLNPRPQWLDEVLVQAQHLASLAPGWDGYHAAAVDRRSLQLASRFISDLSPHVRVTPAIVPTVSGGVALEWHRQGIDLEIEFAPSGEITVMRDDDSEEAFEGPLDQFFGRFVASVMSLP